MYGIILALILLIVANVTYQKVRVIRIKRKLRNQIPNEDVLTWNPEFNKWENIEKSNLKKDILGASAIGAVGSAPSLYYLSEIDPEVIDAMDFAFTEDLSNFNDLHNFVEDKYIDAFSASSADGWITRLEGYVTEQHAAEILEKLGHHVEFPESATEPGYDLIVDGELWQVKGGETIKTIDTHFEKYSDIPVITSETLAQKYDGVGQVAGYSDLNPDIMESTTQQSLGGIDQLGNTMGVGVPVVTLITSGYREIRLLHKGKTNGYRSLENISWDLAGTGGGGLAGAKIGAGIGAFGGPIGAAFGGVIGGIAGAVGGKFGTNFIKARYLKRAIKDYENQVDDSKFEIDGFQENEKLRLEGLVLDINEDLNQYKDYIKVNYQEELESQRKAIIEKQEEFIQQVPNILKSIRDDLTLKESELLYNYKRRSLLKRFINPNENDVFYEEATKWFESRYSIIDKYLNHFNSAEFKQQETNIRYQQIIAFFKEYTADNKILEKELQELLNEQLLVEDIRKDQKRKLFDEINQAENKIRNNTFESFNKIHHCILEQQDLIKDKLMRVEKEREKLGY